MNASVIVPAYNAEKVIKRCLDALLNQTTSKNDYEVIVVDDGSRDKTAQIIRSYSNVRLIQQPNRGPAYARNEGARQALGRIIVFVDSDCEPEPNWLYEMLKPFNQDDIVAVKGAYKTKQKSLIARFNQFEFEYKYVKLARNKYIDFVDSYSAAFLKPVFDELKGFDTRFPTASSEDADLSFRLAKKGSKMVFNPDAIVYHIHPSNLHNYLKRKYKYSYWRALVTKRYPRLSFNDSYTPSSFKIQLLLIPLILCSILYFPFGGPANLFILLLSFVSFFVVTLPFLIGVINRDWRIAIVTPFILFLRAFTQLFGLTIGMMKHLLGRDEN
ncbi:glycosyltransferase [Candidatus Poribacteria bacterium]|nr:glycosyltransferase [Candidatus Poribacteria bacterium]